MSKKTLLAIAIAASLTPALAANSADTTSTDSSAPALFSFDIRFIRLL